MNRLYKNDQTTSEKGFTLIELITVILLLGIIGVMGSEVITSSFKGFSETDTSMELFEEGKLAMMRMEREIHHMVPNAIDDPTNAPTINFGIIDFVTLNSTATPITGQYQPVGATLKIKDLSNNALALNTLISISNTNWIDFSSTTNRKIYQINPVAGSTMTLDKPVIDGHSATMRYYPVQWIIRYSFDATTSTLSRSQAAVSLAGNLITALDGAPAYPLLTHIDALTFNYSPVSLTSNALVSINFTLTHKGTTLDFHKEIQVRNVP